MKYIVQYLRTGWQECGFELLLNDAIDKQVKKGWSFKDIKISSNGDHTLLIFCKKVKS